MSEEIKIETGVPIPTEHDWKTKTPGGDKRIVEMMCVNDSVVLPRNKVSNFRFHIIKAGHKCAVRRVGNGQYRVWKGAKK